MLLHEPDGWTEDYTLTEAAWLAALLHKASHLVPTRLTPVTSPARRRTTGERVLQLLLAQQGGAEG